MENKEDITTDNTSTQPKETSLSIVKYEVVEEDEEDIIDNISTQPKETPLDIVKYEVVEEDEKYPENDDYDNNIADECHEPKPKTKATENKEHFRHIMLFYYRKGKSVPDTQRKICDVYGEEAVNVATCRKWFKKFRQNNFNLRDSPRPGRPSGIDGDELLAIIKNGPHKTTRELGQMLGVGKSTVSKRLRELGVTSVERPYGFDVS